MVGVISETIDVATYFDSGDRPTIDVRAPGEFTKGHVPGAINIPLFDDEERARVGIMYKNDGRNDAIAEGLRLVGKKADRLLAGLEQFSEGERVFVHCWRGGMRSEGFAWLALRSGLRPQRIAGGYKAYRTAVHESFERPRRIVILSGFTGAGKTALLGELRDAGEQIIDLEALANHRGSAFGGIGQPAQPTVEQFENDLFVQWQCLDPSKPVWIEGESQAIGRAQVPQAVWQQMCEAPTVFVEADRTSRVEFLMEHYGTLPASDLADAIGRVKKRLGGLRHQAALDALESDDLKTFASIALEYYDKAYRNALDKRPREKTEYVDLEKAGVARSLDDLIGLGEKISQ
ncbi:MAG: tRNA 2-selenouridine(34) synthase MnmH [Rubripirellula sp.]